MSVILYPQENSHLPVNTLVRVISQPHSLRELGEYIGRNGIIEAIAPDGKRALFQGLTLDGHFNGTVWLPWKSFVKDESPKWQLAYSRYQQWMQELNALSQKRQERLMQVANENGITVEKLLEISQAVSCA